MVKRESVISKHLLETKGIKCTYSKVLKIRVTHTMIPKLITLLGKNHLSHKTKPMMMDAAATDKIDALKGRKYGPSTTMLKVDPALGTPCLGPVGLET
jgi:hypothetical protein